MEYAADLNVKALMDIRRQKGFSLENLSDHLKVSKSELSRMEQGKRKMPQQLFDNAMKFMDIQWDYETVADLEKRIRNMISYLYEMELEKASGILDILMKEKKQHLYSNQYFWWLLVDYIGSEVFLKIKHLERNTADLEESIFSCYDIYPYDIQILLKDLRSLRTDPTDKMDRNQNIDLFNRCSSAWTLLVYHQFQKIARSGSLYEAIEVYYRIESMLKTHRNFKRLLDIDVLKSAVLTRMEEYEPAEMILLNTIRHSEQLNYVDLKKRILENLIWNRVKAGDSEKALKYMKEAAEACPDHLDDSNLVFAPLCLLDLEREKDASQAVTWIQQNMQLDKLNQKILTMEECLIKRNSRMFVRHAENCVREALRLREPETAKLILDIQIRFYELNKNWEEAFKKTVEKNEITRNTR